MANHDAVRERLDNEGQHRLRLARQAYAAAQVAHRIARQRGNLSTANQMKHAMTNIA